MTYIPSHLSFSGFELYSLCPYKYSCIYIKKMKEPSNQYALFGSAIHELLDLIYTTKTFTREFASKKWRKILEKEILKPEYSHIYTSKLFLQLENRGYKEIEKFFEIAELEGILKPAIASEQIIGGHYKTVLLKGKIDLILTYKNQLAILDWKTGSSDPKNLMQLALYATLYSKKFNVVVDNLILCYFKFKQFVVQPFNSEIKQQAKKFFEDIFVKLVVDDTFAPSPNKYCDYCFLYLSHKCPHFHREVII